MVRTGEKSKAVSESRANVCLGEVSVTLVTSQSAYFSRTVPFIINKFSLDPPSHVEHFRRRRHPVHFPKSDYSEQLQGLNVILKKRVPKALCSISESSAAEINYRPAGRPEAP